MNFSLGVSVNRNCEVQLNDMISAPLANVTTSTCNVSPVSLARAVELLLRNVPAADSQLIVAENPAPGFEWISSVSRRYVILHERVTFCPRIGGFVTTPHAGLGSVINQISTLFHHMSSTNTNTINSSKRRYYCILLNIIFIRL